ncbi:c-type cytochrome [Aureitalea sp. L0-47]|uniref:c-type cytochrome n=1 Tax=Aureitalea sp. L0-47 TaxID=2816962 RepID=UPI002238EBF2|nr:cytochrome c [Aureitalea sp. L0-47]MCW5518921.1 c-type cytochrome [Aureitalea sp. L0-47]
MKSIYYTMSMIAALLLFQSCGEKVENYSESEETAVSEEDLIKKGEYLVENMGCAHCHSPKKLTEKGPVPDMDKWLMGFPANDSLPPIPSEMMGSSPWVLMHPDLTAAIGPWGTSYAGNLTPDDSGIGSWTLEQFKKAIKQGKYKGMDNNRPMMPPMPVYSTLSDDDITAIFTYLKSIKPIDNVPPSYRPPSPMN